MVTPPQLEMACDDLKCQIECASSKANEQQQLGEGTGKVTWPAGLYLQIKGQALGSQR